MPSFNVSEVPGSIIPNAVQHHLLKAALSDFECATVHWNLLKKSLGLDVIDVNKVKGTLLAQLYDKLDLGAARLLPMVYKNLNKLNDPLLQAIKSYYRYIWAQNHYYYDQLKKITAALPASFRHITVLKGLAIAFYYSNDPAIRVMEDVDILADTDQVNLLLQKLEKQYPLKNPYKLSRVFKVLHAATFQVGKSEVDLHWQLFPEHNAWSPYKEPHCLRPLNAELGLWVLSPTDAVFHTIVHGIKPNALATIRWISDCAIIQRQHPIDWPQILRLACRLNYIERVRIAFNVLPEYDILIPDAVLHEMDAIPPNKNELYFLLTLQKFQRKQRGYLNKIMDNLELIYWYHKTYKLGVLSFMVALPLHFFYRTFLLCLQNKLVAHIGETVVPWRSRHDL